MSMQIEGMEQLRKNLDSFLKDADKEVASALLSGGKLIEGEAKKRIQETSTGEVVTRYRQGGKSYQHTTSKEGDAPNTDTGALARSVTTEVEPDGVYVGTNMEYAPHLEFGTMSMGARPFLNPAKQAKQRDVLRLVATASAEAISRADTN